MNGTLAVQLSEYDLPDVYKERVFGATEDNDFWNPSGRNPSVFLNRPFCEWDEYKVLIARAWSESDYRTACVLAQLAVIDEQWKELNTNGPK